MKFEEYLIRISDPSVRIGQKCPKCGSDKVVFLHYGLDVEEELQLLVEAGDVIQMGCVMGNDNLACRDCEHSWQVLPMYNPLRD